MNNSRILFSAWLLLVGFFTYRVAFIHDAQKGEGEVVARIKGLKGQVKVMRAGGLEWFTLSKEDTLHDGDMIQTSDNSQIKLAFNDGRPFLLGSKAMLKITRDNDDENKVLLALFGGRLKVQENTRDSSIDKEQPSLWQTLFSTKSPKTPSDRIMLAVATADGKLNLQKKSDSVFIGHGKKSGRTKILRRNGIEKENLSSQHHLTPHNPKWQKASLLTIPNFKVNHKPEGEIEEKPEKKKVFLQPKRKKEPQSSKKDSPKNKEKDKLLALIPKSPYFDLSRLKAPLKIKLAHLNYEIPQKNLKLPSGNKNLPLTIAFLKSNSLKNLKGYMQKSGHYEILPYSPMPAKGIYFIKNKQVVGYLQGSVSRKNLRRFSKILNLDYIIKGPLDAIVTENITGVLTAAKGGEPLYFAHRQRVIRVGADLLIRDIESIEGFFKEKQRLLFTQKVEILAAP